MNVPSITTLPPVIVGCISEFLTVGQLSNVGKTCHACHRQFWLENDLAWRDQIGARFHAMFAHFGISTRDERYRSGRDATIRCFKLINTLYRRVYEHVIQAFPDLASLLAFDQKEEPGFRVFAYVHTHELKSAIRDITKQQCCGSGSLHVIRGCDDADMIEALAAMDASRETECFTARGHRDVYCYLAEWPPQTKVNDLVLILTGALRSNNELLRTVPDRLQHRVLLAHCQGVEVPKNQIQTLIQSFPRVALTDSFCQRPKYASVLGGLGSSKEFPLDMARFFSLECGKGSAQAQTLVLSVGGGANLRRTFIRYDRD